MTLKRNQKKKKRIKIRKKLITRVEELEHVCNMQNVVIGMLRYALNKKGLITSEYIQSIAEQNLTLPCPAPMLTGSQEARPTPDNMREPEPGLPDIQDHRIPEGSDDDNGSDE